MNKEQKTKNIDIGLFALCSLSLTNSSGGEV